MRVLKHASAAETGRWVMQVRETGRGGGWRRRGRAKHGDQTRVAGYAGRDRRQTTGTAHTPGRGKVPVENGGDDGHWREDVFMDELMDPVFTTGSSEALSAITILT